MKKLRFGRRKVKVSTEAERLQWIRQNFHLCQGDVSHGTAGHQELILAMKRAGLFAKSTYWLDVHTHERLVAQVRAEQQTGS